MSTINAIAVTLAGSAFALVAAPALAQDGVSFSVGRIDSAKTCTLYQQSAGRAGAIITPRAIGVYASWRTWLVKDCVDNFAGIRNAIETALAASGGVALRGQGGRYTIVGRISEVSGEPSSAPQAPDLGRDGFSAATNSMRVVIDVTVRDKAGRIVFGIPLVKTIETGSDIRVGSFRASSNESGQALYARLQQEVALSVARAVAFHFNPLRVITSEDRTIRLDYGAPLVRIGMIVQVSPPGGVSVLRYKVTSATGDSAIARFEGSGDPTRAVPGSLAVVIEADDPAANGPRYDKVDLP